MKQTLTIMLQRNCIHQWQRHLEGLEVEKRSSTSYGINTENSWKDAVEGGDFASICCYIKAIFDALKSANETGYSSWTKLTKRGSLAKRDTTFIAITKSTFIWELCLYGLTSKGTLIISKTSIYTETTTNTPPAAYVSNSETDTTPSKESLL